jgi:hypothetical protein
MSDPKQGDKAPWVNHQTYKLDKQTLNEGPLDDGILIFSGGKDIKEFSLEMKSTIPFFQKLAVFFVGLTTGIMIIKLIWDYPDHFPKF